jgi:hypothetical protein
MWILAPAIYLAIAHIAGDNVAVVPDMAAVKGFDIYVTTIIAYILFGSLSVGLTAWISVKTGSELGVVSKRLFGHIGKKTLAFTILAICIPASALTGGYYAGWVLHVLTGMPLFVTAPICLGIFSLLAAGYGQEILKISNYIALALLPAVFCTLFTYKFTMISIDLNIKNIDWVLVSALIGYNAGGMRSALVAETATHLSTKGYKAVYLVILAKLIEGIFTLMMAHLILLSGTNGPLALAGVMETVWGINFAYVFYFVLFCVFMNTMAPAMMVNARQVSILSGLSFWPALIISLCLVSIASFINYSVLLSIMSCTGLMMAIFIVYIACFLHKYGIN